MVEDDVKKEIERLREEIQKKKEEIEQIRKNVDDLNAKLQEKGHAEGALDLRNMVNEISDLFNVTFGILGVSRRTKEKTKVSGGLLDLINNLAELSEKTESFRKEFELAGKRGVVEYEIKARPLKGRTVGHESLYRRPARKGIAPISGTYIQTGKSAEEKEPIIDITDEDDEVTVLVELPGLNEKDITVDVEEKKLKVNIDKEKTETREVILPRPVEKTGFKLKYKNGILEVRLKKAKQEEGEKT